MANVKEIYLTGCAPFDLHEHAAIQPYLAWLASPLAGVRIHWGKEPCRMQPNEYGGKTAIYEFKLVGHDALSWRWIEGFKDAMQSVGGYVDADYSVDPEDL